MAVVDDNIVYVERATADRDGRVVTVRFVCQDIESAISILSNLEVELSRGDMADAFARGLN